MVKYNDLEWAKAAVVAMKKEYGTHHKLTEQAELELRDVRELLRHRRYKRPPLQPVVPVRVQRVLPPPLPPQEGRGPRTLGPGEVQFWKAVGIVLVSTLFVSGFTWAATLVTALIVAYAFMSYASPHKEIDR